MMTSTFSVPSIAEKKHIQSLAIIADAMLQMPDISRIDYFIDCLRNLQDSDHQLLFIEGVSGANGEIAVMQKWGALIEAVEHLTQSDYMQWIASNDCPGITYDAWLALKREASA